MNKRIVGLVAVVLLVVLVGASLAVPAGDGDGPDRPDDADTTTTTLPFDPEPGVIYAYRTLYVPNVAIEISVGDTLVFENRDGVVHTLTSDEGLFDSGPVEASGTYGYAYAEPGVYAVHCEIHPTMSADVVVTPATAST